MTSKKDEKKTGEIDKINAIYKMLPIISECHKICMFMLENRGFNKAYQGYIERESEVRKVAEIYSIFDYYGIPRGSENKVDILYSYVYHKEEHIDTICGFLAVNWLDYDRDSFIYQPKKHEKEESREYKPQQNPQFSTYRP